MEINENKRRRRFMGLGFAVLLISITIGCSSVVLGGNSSSTPSSSNASISSASSSSSSSTASSSASSSTASSSSSSSSASSSSSSSSTASSSASSSTVSSSSSSSSASSSSSSSSSSAPVEGPRLTQLASADELTILGSLKNGPFEFFIWSDNVNIQVSTFELNTLFNTEILADAAFNGFNGQAMVAYNDGIIFTIQNYMEMSGNTYYYDAMGIQNTFTDTVILDRSDTVREEGLDLAANVEGTPELHRLVEPSLTPTFLTVLPLDHLYFSYDDSLLGPNDLGPNFRYLASFDPNTESGVLEFFSVDDGNFIKLFDLTQMDLIMGLEMVMFTQAKIFVAEPFKVTIYDTNGGSTDYDGYQAYFFPHHQGVVLDEGMGNDVLVFHQGFSEPNSFTGNVIEFTNSSEEGSSFVVQNLDTSTLSFHHFTDIGYAAVSSVSGYASSSVQFYDDETPQFSLYNAGTDLTTVGYYDQGYVLLNMEGDLTTTNARYFTTINDLPYAVYFDTETITDPNAFDIRIFTDIFNTNPVTTVTLEDLNITNFRMVGMVNQYLIVNLRLGSSTDGIGYVINLANGTYEAIGEDIWYIDNTNGNNFKTVFYETAGFLYGYSWAGAISISLEDPTSFDTTSAGRNDDSAMVFQMLHEDQLGKDQDVVIITTESLPSTGTTELKIYVGDSTLGLPGMALLSTNNLETDSFQFQNVIISGNNVYLLNPNSLEITTLQGNPFNGLVYIQNDILIVLDEELNEVNTGLSFSQGFSMF